MDYEHKVCKVLNLFTFRPNLFLLLILSNLSEKLLIGCLAETQEIAGIPWHVLSNLALNLAIIVDISYNSANTI